MAVKPAKYAIRACRSSNRGSKHFERVMSHGGRRQQDMPLNKRCTWTPHCSSQTGASTIIHNSTEYAAIIPPMRGLTTKLGRIRRVLSTSFVRIHTSCSNSNNGRNLSTPSERIETSACAIMSVNYVVAVSSPSQQRHNKRLQRRKSANANTSKQQKQERN